METLIQKASRHNEKRYQEEQGKLGAFAGRTVTVDTTSDTMKVSFGPASGREMAVPHPFSGSSSWIRSMPEKDTVFLMQHRFDSGQPDAVKTLPVFSFDKAQGYLNYLNTYRTLSSGEHDIVSVGSAHAYFGRRGNLDLRSGASVKVQLNRESQEVSARAPTHKTNLIFQVPGEMGDEQRIGIVKRWDSASSESYVQKSNNFVAEHYLQIKNPSGASPAVLFRRIEGHVYDDSAQEIKHGTTAIPLRSQALWYTTTDEYTKREIDQNGNMLLEFPSTATTGYEVIIPDGSYRKVIGKDRDITIQKDEKVVVKNNINYTVGSNVTYDVTKNVNVNAGKTTLSMLADADSVTLFNGKSYGITATPSSLSIAGPKASLDIGSSGSTTLSAKQSLTLSVDQTCNMEGMMLNANFQKINLGKGAMIPAVLGMALQMYIDQHDHIGNLGLPTSPPTTPSASFNGTPLAITSLKIQLMGNI